jgi:hypothetical protein
MPDVVVVEAGDGQSARVDVIVVWVDPKHTEAYRDPALLDWIEQRAQQYDGLLGALIRFDARRALTLFPPHLTGDGWQEREGSCVLPPR